MNIWDIILSLLILAALFFAVRRVIRVKKSGGCSCCCGCGSAECKNCRKACEKKEGAQDALGGENENK